MTNHNDEMKAYAVKGAKHGLYQVNLYATTDGICNCKRKKCNSPGKHPIPYNGLDDATLDLNEIEGWFRSGRFNLAILTGEINDLCVLDVDPRNGGIESLKMIWEKYGPIDSTHVVLTGSNGLHFYTKYYKSEHSNGAIYPGIDFKTDRGYVVAPPSIHVCGNPYKVITDFDITTYLEGGYDHASI